MKGYLLGIILLVSMSVKAQIKVSELSYRDGLKEEHISTLIQDRQGCIWMATFGGLCSYDGYRSVCYKAKPGDCSQLASNRIQNIICNADGNIWCIAYDKLFLFDIHTRQFTDVQKFIEKNVEQPVEISSLFPLDKQVTWVLGKDGTAFRIDDTQPDKELFPVEFGRGTGRLKNVFQDSYGKEWLITETGLYIYGIEQPQLSRSIDFRSETLEGIWFASRTGDLFFYRFSSGMFQQFLLQAGNIRQLLTSENGSLYIAAEKGVYTYSLTGELAQVLAFDSAAAKLQNISVDSEGYLWSIADNGEVLRCNPDDGHLLRMSLAEAVGPDVTDFSHVLLIENAYGEIWFSLRQWGDLLYWDRFTNTIKQPVEPYHTSDIRGRFVDNQRNLWIRKSRSIDKISFYGIQHHWEVPTAGSEVRCVYRDNEGAIWLADRGGYIRKFDAHRKLIGYLGADGKLTTRKCTFGAVVYSMMQDRDGIFWLGSRYNGLFRWSPKNGDMQNFIYSGIDRFSLSDNAIYDIIQDRQGRIWIGTLKGGLNLMQNGRNGIRFLNGGNGLFHNSCFNPRCVRSLLEIEEQKLILMATMDGLFVFSTQFDTPLNIRLYQNKRRPADYNSIGNNEVLSLMRTRSGEVYAMTNSGGVNRLLSKTLLSDSIRFRSFTEKDGIYSDQVLSMVEDQKGGLWTVSERVLSYFDPKQETFLNYGGQYLRPNLLFSESSPLCFDDGMLLFGTEDGLLTFHPEEMRRPSFVPPIIFTRFMIQGRDLESPVNIDAGREWVLMPEQRTITIGFAALDYNQTQPIRYRYRMLGLDERWIQIDESRSASYVNLPPGEYQFEVESTNSDGTWVKNTRTLPIRVVPTFLETGWAWLLYILTGLSILAFSLYLYRRFYSLKLRVEAEHEIADAKLRFFTDISHELRTPLTLINAPVSDVLKQDHTLSEQTRIHLQMVQRNVNRMLHLVNQILDFRKMQNQKMKLLLQETDIKEILEHTMEYFRPVAEQHHIRFSLECPERFPLLWIDRDKFEKIFFNLLSNAFKYTPDRKQIVVNLSVSAQRVIISVKDEGIGIPEEQLEVLFKRFETVLRSNLFKASSGIGLALIKQFADLHQAQLQVESRVGLGSVFSLSFLMGRNVYAACPYAEFINNSVEIPFTEANDTILAESLESVEPIITPETGNKTASGELVTILVIEDNQELRLFLRGILQRQYRVFEAENGEKGLKAVRECWPDLILSDVMMPVMDGFEMVRCIKSDEDVCHIPIVLLTAKALLIDQIEGIRIGVDDYILKPFNSEYLLIRIAALLEQRCRLQKYYLNSVASVAGSGNISKKEETAKTLAGLTPADELFVQRITAFMEKHLNEPELTVEQLGSEVNMGRTVFFCKVKSIMGCSPVELIQSVRIQHAVRMFDAGECVVSEVAYNVGFNDPKYFSRCFKKQMGVTPTEYLKQLKE